MGQEQQHCTVANLCLCEHLKWPAQLAQCHSECVSARMHIAAPMNRLASGGVHTIPGSCLVDRAVPAARSRVVAAWLISVAAPTDRLRGSSP